MGASSAILEKVLERTNTFESPHSKQNLFATFNRETQAIPLTWAATTAHQPYANLGDALSPIIIAALSGVPVVHHHFDAEAQRLACVGTIGHGLKNGTVHLWGTGIDPYKNPVDSNFKYYKKPPSTRFHIHALRGPLSAQIFRHAGIDSPSIYGDPVWFLPKLVAPASEKRYELGIIIHLSELDELSDTALVKSSFLRHKIPESLSNHVHIISTITQANFTALEERIQDITACKRIVSTSLHGLVIAEAYQIPCAYFRTKGRGSAFLPLEDEREMIDHRMRDFYRGIGLKNLFVYGQPRRKETNWDKLMDEINTYWQPIQWSAASFLEAFPLPLAFNPLQKERFNHRSLLQKIVL